MLKKIMRLYVLIALSIIPMMARADGEVTLDSIIGAAHNGTDKSLALLGYILGHGNGVNFSGGGRFEQVFLILNGIALVLGLVYFVFVAVSGVAQTAHDGEFLGKRYSSIWLPIRFSIGTMSIVPIVGGWGIAQVAMLWMTVMGVGSANLVTEAMVSDKGIFQQAKKQYNVPTPNAYFAARTLFNSNVCMAAINAGIDEFNSQEEAAREHYHTYNPIGPEERIMPFIDGNIIRFVMAGKFDDPEAKSCGSVEFAFETKNGKADPLLEAKVVGLNQMQSTLLQSATKFVNGEPYDDLAVSSAAVAYENALREGANKYAANADIRAQRDKADAILKDGGWIMLGAMYQSYATYNTALINSITKLPQTTSPDPFDEFSPLYNRKYLLASYALNKVDRRTAQDILEKSQSTYKDRFIPSPGLAAIEGIKNMANSLGGNSTDYPDPLIGLKNVGDAIIVTYESMMAVKLAVELWAGRAVKVAETADKVAATGGLSGAEGTKSSPFIGKLIDIGGMVGIVLNILFFTGIVLSMWVPLIPFVTWISGVISWITVVVESIIAAPLWAMAHFEAEGEGMGQRTTHGYLFAVNLLLRPMLMVLGFISALLILTAMGNLVSTLFMTAVENAQIDEAGGTSTTGLVSVPVYVIIYGILMLMLVNKSFDLIHFLPDTVTAWLGGHMRGDHGRGGEKDAHGMVVGAVTQGKAMPKLGSSSPTSGQSPRSPGGGSSGGNGRSGGGNWPSSFDPSPAPMRGNAATEISSSKTTKNYDLD